MTAAPGPWDLFVVTAPGLEEITGGELAALGLPPLGVEPGGLGLKGDPAILWRLNLHLRTASRVLVRVAAFRAVGFQELEKRARRVSWGDFLPPGTDPSAVEFEVTCRKSRLYHSGAVEARLREAMAEVLGARGRGASGGAASAGALSADQGVVRHPDPVPAPRFVVRLLRNRLTLSADASGEHLHRRGYREAVGKAPLRETLAAALLLAAGWRGERPLLDPFCGSGTLPIEAALLAGGVAPGLGRRFAFEAWPGVDPEEGLRARAEAMPDAAAPAGPGTSGGATPMIRGTDRDPGAIRAARENAARAGVSERVEFVQAALSEAPFPAPPGLLATNPPYGHRVGDAATLRNLYARLGDRLRTDWSGGDVVLLSADRALTAQLGLETRVLFRTRNGGIPVEAVAARIP